MKNEKVIKTENKKKSVPGSDPVNKFKKSKSGVSANSVTSVIKQTKATAGRGLANEGTVASYDEER